MAFCCSSLSASAVLTAGLAISSGSGGGSSSIRSRGAAGPPNLRVCSTLASPMRVVCMAPEEEKMTRRSPLDFPIEWERPKPGRRPDIFPQFSPMKTPLPPPLPADPPEEDEEEEEKKEEEEEDPEKEENPDNPEKQGS